MWRVVKKAKDENKYELLIANKELTEELAASNGLLDPAIFELDQLNFLRLVGSPLEQIPDQIGNLQNLTSLDLQNNNISIIPKSIKNLKKLKLLDLSENKLQSLPEEINELTALTRINVRKNELSELISFEGCTALAVIDVRINKLKTFEEICHDKLNLISELYASFNEITEIPAEIGCLSSLKNLNLAENFIKETPFELLHCPKLKELNLKENPFVDRRFRKLVESDRGYTHTILSYLKKNAKDYKGKAETGKNKKNKNTQSEEIIDDLCDCFSVLSAQENLIIKTSAEVRDIRGYIICCILRNLDLTGLKLKKFLTIQTKLHETICQKRVAATVATHALEKVFSPLHYCAKPPNEILIHPLNRPAKVTAVEFQKSLKAEAELMRKQMKKNTCSGIHKYIFLIDGLEKWPCLVDSKQNVISFPPITNAHETKIENETKDILVEVTTSVSLKKGKEVMEELLKATLEADLSREKSASGKKLLIVEQVRVLDEHENLRLVFPSRTDLVFDPNSKIAVIRA